MKRIGSALLWLTVFAPVFSSAQIDPVRRDLIQFGYNQALEGRPPLAGYAYYYHNQPDFLRTNLTLRLALAPVYLDSELGFNHGLGPNTDFAIGLAGGGFADSYSEIRGGTYLPSESFDGNGAEISASIYHLFNPGDEIPLNLVLRGTAHYSFYDRNDSTADAFQLPSDHGDFSVRTGLRWGGIEPTLFPPLAMELSVWYEGHLRSDPGAYGFGGDRELNGQSHLFWAEAALAYTLPESRQSFYVRLTAGTSADADRFSAYRLGGFLPLVAEFPLSLPGYYFQEISARQFVLLNGNYLLPLDKNARWNFDLNAASAVVDYLPGESQPGSSLNGVGGGILFRSRSDRLKIMLTYAYGIDAIRDGGRGAQNIGLLLQWDLQKTRGEKFNPAQPNNWRGWQWLFGN
ncbi:MAG TPA: hypothetical protein VMV89_01260 [Candidatus Paceibacterota bacterium]|nr:hypothetical protein [Candidatus Paceibacterota bacterium]